MNRQLRNACLATGAALMMVTAGVVLANDNYSCSDMDTSSCVMVDLYVDDNCCKDVDGTGKRLWTCTREVYDCIDGGEIYFGWLGGGYNCTNPQGLCE
jgi:hypothetical protein